MTTLKETSKDKHNDGSEYSMTDSLLEVVDFDNVKNHYIRDLDLATTPKSNDALLIKSDGKSVFIEFKNGCVKEYDIRKKIYDSLLISTDIINKGISYTRQHTDYILVYNGEKNNTTDEDPKTRVQVSESRDRIAKTFTKWGKTNYIKFGLHIFKNYCFRNVCTYTKDEFESFLSSLNDDNHF